MRVLNALLYPLAAIRRLWQDWFVFLLLPLVQLNIHTYSLLWRTPHGTDLAGATHTHLPGAGKKWQCQQLASSQNSLLGILLLIWLSVKIVQILLHFFMECVSALCTLKLVTGIICTDLWDLWYQKFFFLSWYFCISGSRYPKSWQYVTL